MSEQEMSTNGEEDAEGEASEAADVDLEAFVAEHPEEVQRLLERLDTVNELLDTAELATSAVDDRMAQELTATSTNLMAAADGMATEEVSKLGEATGENAEELADAIEGMAALQRSGTLDDLLEMADILALLSDAMDDEMVMTLAATGTRFGELADVAADDDVAGSLESMLEALGEAGGEEPSEVGALGLVGALRDDDVKRGMGFLIEIARALGRSLD